MSETQKKTKVTIRKRLPCPQCGKGNMFDYYDKPSDDDVCSDCEESQLIKDPCETCIMCVDKYDYKNTGKMCLVHDPSEGK